MTLVNFIRLLIYHFKILIAIPVIIFLLIFIFYRNEKLNYLTSSTIYTGFASGYTVNQEKRDFFLIKTKFDNLFENIKSRTSREEIILKTLAFYLSQDSISKRDMSLDNQLELNNLFTYEIVKKVVVKNNEEETYKKLNELYRSNFENPIYFILNVDNSSMANYFGLKKLLSIEALQEGTSDRVILKYETTDPGISFHTTRIALDVIMNDVKEIKVTESDDVFDYFLTESRKAKEKLDNAEAELSELMTKHNIINYYEQTKWLASRNEDFEVAFQEEKLKLTAAKAAEKEAFSKMKIGKDLFQIKEEINTKRKELKDASSKIAFYEIQSKNPLDTIGIKNIDVSENELNIYRDNATLIKDELQEKVEQLYHLKQTTSGINIEDIASTWLNAIISVEEYTARIEQYMLFKQEFEITYSRFAQLGSKMKQMQRKIAVLEQDYLNLLKSVNDSKLIKQNIEMSTNLRVVDPPFYPVNAEKSIKSRLLVGGSIAGFILTLAILILLEYLDESVKNPERMKELTKLYVAGGFPLINKKSVYLFEKAHDLLIKQIVTYINFNYYQNETQKDPFIVLFFSTRKKEGKTQLSTLIAEEMRKIGEPTLVLSPKSDKIQNQQIETQDIDNIEYELPQYICDVDLNDKAFTSKKDLHNYRYIFLEIPSIIGSDLPIKIIKQANLSLLIVKSSRNWNKADSMALESYQRISKTQTSGLINGVHIDSLETIIGEIPKERSRFRKKIKSILNFKLSEDNF